jgi:cell division protein ZipA
MPELRWILIATGTLLLIGIYIWGRRAARESAASEDAALRMRPEPQMPAAESADRFSMPAETEQEAVEVDAPPAYTRPVDFSTTAIRATAPREEEVDFQSQAAADAGYRPVTRDLRRGRIEPTFDDTPTEDVHTTTAELPVIEAPQEEPAVPQDAPTLSMSSTPAPKRIERRKIIALRLAAGTQRFPGAQLRQTLEEESLAYGKYDVFHRVHTDGNHVFSVASMVEPGTFDLEKMASLTYPGVTLFAQLPGPVAGIDAFSQLTTCGKRLQEQLGGTLQDERGVPLTVHRMERLRQEIREFESLHGREPNRDGGLH